MRKQLVQNQISPQHEAEVSDRSNSGVGCCGILLMAVSLLMIALTFPISLLLCIKILQQYERAVILRLGRIVSGRPKGPGLLLVLPCTDQVLRFDMRTVVFNVPAQELLTRDSVTVAVDAVVFYRINSPVAAATKVQDVHSSTRYLAQTSLRNVLGANSLTDVLVDRTSINSEMQAILDEATDPWGVQVERVAIKDVRLPVQLQRAMAAEAEAARMASAKVVAAEGEQRASTKLRDAADTFADCPAALQLRHLQTLSSIAEEQNSTVLFPVPMDFGAFAVKCSRHTAGIRG